MILLSFRCMQLLFQYVYSCMFAMFKATTYPKLLWTLNVLGLRLIGDSWSPSKLQDMFWHSTKSKQFHYINQVNIL